MGKEILSMENIIKSYQMGGEEQIVLKGINLTIHEGEFLSILGPSGSGKSTMMNIIGCLDTPTSGKYFLGGQNISQLDQKQLAHIRNKDIGFVFQSFQLLPRLSARENVELPLIYGRMRPSEMSGGQKQRVAIARALATNPTILLADEPTGALDQKTGRQVMMLFRELNQEGNTIIMITHDKSIAKNASRIVRLLDGVLTEGDEDDA